MHLFGPQHYETRNQAQEKKSTKRTNKWRIKNMLLNNEWVSQKKIKEIQRYIEANENENTRVQNFQYRAKAVLRVKVIKTEL